MEAIACYSQHHTTQSTSPQSQTGRLAGRVVTKRDGEEAFAGIIACCALCMLAVSLGMLIPGALAVQGGLIMSAGGGIALTVLGALGLTYATYYLMSASSACLCGAAVSNFIKLN